MKKAIYLLSVAVLAVGTLHALVLSDSRLVELKEQNTTYELQVAELESQIKLRDARIFELVNVNDSYETQIADYVNIVNDNNDVIAKLEEQLEIKHQEEERARLRSMQVVFDPSDVTKPSNVGVERLTKALKGTNLEPLAPKFVEIEETKNINAIYMAAKTAWESGWGKSELAVYCNNLGGVKNPGGNGYRTFASKEACLEYMAKFLSMSYLDENGVYYNGKSIKAVSQNYNFGEQSWIDGITSIGYGLLAKSK